MSPSIRRRSRRSNFSIPRQRRRHTLFLHVVVVLAGLILRNGVRPHGDATVDAAANNNNNKNNNSSNHQRPNPPSGTPPPRRDPFQILGIGGDPHTTTTVDDATVKRRYRQLCLDYHPDKKHHLPLPQRQKYEALFKELQQAYELIGTAQARRDYARHQQRHHHHRFNQNFDSFTPPPTPHAPWRQHSNNNPFHSTFTATDAQRQFFNTAFFPFVASSSSSPSSRPPHVPFFGNVAPPPPSSHSFAGFSTTRPTTAPSEGPDGFGALDGGGKSVYRQTVLVSLSDLYTGRTQYQLPAVRDNVWTRVVAAVRGRIAYALMLRSLLCSIPIAFILSYKLALFWSLVLSVGNLPCLSRNETDNNLQTFTANLQPGYKGNTKLIFVDKRSSVGIVEVHFVLKEAPHSIYSRIGNDLHASCRISPRQAAAGCQFEIPSLSDPDFTMMVDIPRNAASGDQVVVPGKGWPNRKAGLQKGNLVVTVLVRGESQRKSSGAR